MSTSRRDPLALFRTDRHSRRAALRGGMAGLAVVVLDGAGGGAIAAQEASPAALPSAINEWIAGWQSLDPDRVASVYTEDAIHEVVATGDLLEGREALRTNVAALMTAIPDASLVVNDAFATASRGVVDWTFSGHYQAPMPGFPPPTGQALVFRAVTIFELSGDQAVRTTEFYDFFGLLVQLGVLPAPGGMATPTS